VRELTGGGGDALIDAAALGAPALTAVRDGGKVAAVRAFEGETERGIEVLQVRVSDYATNRPALEALGELVAKGRLTLRVADTFPPEQAAVAQVQLSAGGVRGRLVIVF
jgi:NADPH:quinone reductase-like Zn-dependent oxidoreductase